MQTLVLIWISLWRTSLPWYRIPLIPNYCMLQHKVLDCALRQWGAVAILTWSAAADARSLILLMDSKFPSGRFSFLVPYMIPTGYKQRVMNVISPSSFRIEVTAILIFPQIRGGCYVPCTPYQIEAVRSNAGDDKHWKPVPQTYCRWMVNGTGLVLRHHGMWFWHNQFRLKRLHFL